MQRTRAELNRMGRKNGIVERFIHNKYLNKHGIRSDLFHIFDIIAMKKGDGIIGVQVCGPDYACHYRKITEDYGENAIEWMVCGGKIELWGWRKLKVKRGGKAMRWYPRVHEFSFSDFKGIYIPVKLMEVEQTADYELL